MTQTRIIPIQGMLMDDPDAPTMLWRQQSIESDHWYKSPLKFAAPNAVAC